MDSFNIKLNNLKINLINTINNADVPVGAVYYLLKDLLIETSESYQQALSTEKQIEMLKQSVEKDNEIDRDAGEYATFYIEDVNIGASKKIVEKLGSAIKELCGEGTKRALFLGMGNSEIISDTLGIKT